MRSWTAAMAPAKGPFYPRSGSPPSGVYWRTFRKRVSRLQTVPTGWWIATRRAFHPDGGETRRHRQVLWPRPPNRRDYSDKVDRVSAWLVTSLVSRAEQNRQDVASSLVAGSRSPPFVSLWHGYWKSLSPA